MRPMSTRLIQLSAVVAGKTGNANILDLDFRRPRGGLWPIR